MRRSRRNGWREDVPNERNISKCGRIGWINVIDDVDGDGLHSWMQTTGWHSDPLSGRWRRCACALATQWSTWRRRGCLSDVNPIKWCQKWVIWRWQSLSNDDVVYTSHGQHVKQYDDRTRVANGGNTNVNSWLTCGSCASCGMLMVA